MGSFATNMASLLCHAALLLLLFSLSMSGNLFVVHGQDLLEIPADLNFTCENRTYGYYADPDTNCQVFHVCLGAGDVKWSFICPNQTLFSQQFFVCDYAFNVDCGQAESFYHLNDNFAGNAVNSNSSSNSSSTNSSSSSNNSSSNVHSNSEKHLNSNGTSHHNGTDDHLNSINHNTSDNHFNSSTSSNSSNSNSSNSSNGSKSTNSSSNRSSIDDFFYNDLVNED